MAGGLTPKMRAELKALGFRPRRRLGQNFMRDGNMLAALAEASGAGGAGGAGDGDLVLEPGPGAGGLTARLLELGAEVTAVELDPLLAGFLRGRFTDRERFHLIEGDVLDSGRRLNAEAVARLAGRPFRVCSNLPYSAATTFLVALAGSDLAWRAAAVTVQLEVAGRLTSSPGTPGYGAATVLVAARAEARLLRKVPPSVFWPQPKVESAIVRLEPLAEPSVAAADFDDFAALVRALFSARRKRLVRALTAANLDPGAARLAIETARLDPGVRPGELSPAEFARLWRAIDEVHR